MEIHRRILPRHVINLKLPRRSREFPRRLGRSAARAELRGNHAERLTRIRLVAVNVLDADCRRAADRRRDRRKRLEIDAAVRIRVHRIQIEGDACIVLPLRIVGLFAALKGEYRLTGRRVYRQHIARIRARLIQRPLDNLIAVARHHRCGTRSAAAAAQRDRRRRAAVAVKLDFADVLFIAVVNL